MGKVNELLGSAVLVTVGDSRLGVTQAGGDNRSTARDTDSAARG